MLRIWIKFDDRKPMYHNIMVCWYLNVSGLSPGPCLHNVCDELVPAPLPSGRKEGETQYLFDTSRFLLQCTFHMTQDIVRDNTCGQGSKVISPSATRTRESKLRVLRCISKMISLDLATLRLVRNEEEIQCLCFCFP
jgi:hypothetical protein